MTEKEILEIIEKGENIAIEFKEEDVKKESIANEITAFSNTSGGLIILGVNDDKKITGIHRKFNIEEWAMNISRNNVVPAVDISFSEYHIEDKKIAVIEIPKGTDRPYQTIKGKFLVRVGSTNRQATQNELMRLFQQVGFFHFDLNPVENTSFKDIDFTKIDEYFSRYDIDITNESETEKIKLLQNTDILTKDNKMTVGGLLIFGLNPQKHLHNASISFAHFQGIEISDKLIDKQTIRGTLPNQINSTLAVIKNNLLNPSVLKFSKRQETSFNYKDFVFKELITNACVHRNYSITGSSIRIFIFSDRIEFISPGRLPNTVTTEKLKAGVSYAVNPVIVKFMENMRFIDKIGRGLPMVYKEAVRNNKNIEFKEIGEEFKVVLEL